MNLIDAFLVVLLLYVFIIGFEMVYTMWMGMKK